MTSYTLTGNERLSVHRSGSRRNWIVGSGPIRATATGQGLCFIFLRGEIRAEASSEEDRDQGGGKLRPY